MASEKGSPYIYIYVYVKFRTGLLLLVSYYINFFMQALINYSPLL